MTFDSLSPVAVAEGVLVRRVTASVNGTIGFRVLRETVVSTREQRLTPVVEMMPAAGHGLAGASYELLDDSKDAALAVAHYSEEIDVYGKVTRHVPLVIERGSRELPRVRSVQEPRRQRQVRRLVA